MGALRALAPGVAVAGLLAVAAQFLSEHYGAPAMLMALLLGIAFHFLAEEGRSVPGIHFAARTVLRLGVTLLGARISAEMLVALGPAPILLVMGAVVATILFGWGAGRLMGQGWRFGVLTGGAVAICGASAAMAIAAVLPRDDRAEGDLVFTVLGVTVLSTLAMIAYPVLVGALDLGPAAAGVFLGGTIHDVAQVVGAGFSVSEEAGETATLVKLFRVAMLAPVVLVLSLVMRRAGGDGGPRPPLVPPFVAGFLALATLNSLHLIPAGLGDLLSGLSRWALLTAIAAMGMKTSLRAMVEMGGRASGVVVAETAFVGALVLSGILLLGL